MLRETDTAESLGEGGNPDADRQLAENFGMTVKQVREFDPQTLDVTRACKFLGMPLRRFDALAGQPEARDRWVASVARERKDLIETFPHAGKDIKEMLEAIRKFALRKCLKPDGPALVEGATTSNKQRGNSTRLLGGAALVVALLAGTVAAVLMSAGGGPGKQSAAPAGGDVADLSSGSGSRTQSRANTSPTNPPSPASSPTAAAAPTNPEPVPPSVRPPSPGRPSDEPIRSAKVELDGEWGGVECVVGGKAMSNQLAASRQLLIAGSKYTLTFDSSGVDGKHMHIIGDVQYDAEQRPKTLQFISRQGNGNESNKGKPQLAIYELRGDELRFCQGTPDGPRPNKFDASPKGWSLQTYRKVSSR